MSNCIFHHLNSAVAFNDTGDAMPDEMALWPVRNLFCRSEKQLGKDQSALNEVKLNCLFNINFSFLSQKKSQAGFEDV